MRSMRDVNATAEAAPVQHDSLMRREAPKPLLPSVKHESLMRREVPKETAVATPTSGNLMRREAPRPPAASAPQSGRLMRSARPEVSAPPATPAESPLAKAGKGFKGHNFFLLMAGAGMLFSLFRMAQRAMKRTTTSLNAQADKEG